MTFHRGHPLTVARHEALRSPLPQDELGTAVDPQWLRSRADLFMEAAERSFVLTLDLDHYASRTGLQFHTHYAAQVFRGKHTQRLEVPLMAVNLVHVRTREAADKVLAHECMHLRVPSYGHKTAAFACAQRLLDGVGSLTV
jgi:hypothetical protein